MTHVHLAMGRGMGSGLHMYLAMGRGMGSGLHMYTWPWVEGWVQDYTCTLGHG